jgi:hypothetical protein
VLRLARAAAPTKGAWDIALLALLVVFLTLYGLVGMDQDHKGRHLSGLGMIWFVLLSYIFHIGTGLANRAWRVLPVSLRERRAAAWVLVAVLPLVLDLVATLGGAVAIAALEGDHAVAQRALALFGLRGMAMESYAALAICLGNWPASAAYLSQLDRRQPRDWLMLIIAGLLCVALAVGADPIMARPALAPFTSAMAIALCAVLLPISLRLVRLDAQVQPKGAFDGVAETITRRYGLRFAGWPGHFARQALRTAAIWIGMVAFFGVIVWLLPAPASTDTPDAAFRAGMRAGATLGTASAEWIMPAMAAALIAIMTQQYLFRARLMLLTLPRGGLLVMITPLFNASLAWVATLALVWPALIATPGWVEKLVASLLYALAMVHLALALNLRATSYAHVMVNSLVLGVTGGGAGFVGAMAAHEPQRIEAYLPMIGAMSLVVLAGSLVWCHWQLRHGRSLYRPWPGSAGTWRAA